MRKSISSIILLIIFSTLSLYRCTTNKSIEPVKLRFEQDETVTYDEAIEIYTKLDNQFKTAKLLTYGNTDIGKPLHLFVISKDKDFDPISIRKKNKRIILINNGIHPGEPCGIDASIKFADEILRNENNLAKILENTVICMVPIYNIGGALNRSAYNRANQETPKECGFRGNARNLDLNRDFAKCDSKNALTFSEILHTWKPDVFLDTHTTNGSDHKYSITLIPMQHNSMHPVIGEFFNKQMIPELYRKMNDGPYEMIPYINYLHRDPKKGVASYVASPRYGIGYTNLFNIFSFITENHIYKPYKDRVLSVYYFIIELAKFTNENSNKIKELRTEANLLTKIQKEFSIQWELDTSKRDSFHFIGYEAKYKTSLLSGMERFYYDKNDPFEKDILFYDNYKPALTVKKPIFYIIPQAWKEAVKRLELNKVNLQRLTKDTTLMVEVYYITDYATSERSYNGHYFHEKVSLRSEMQDIKYYKGDYVIEMNQKGNRYIVEMLEPQAEDSFFKWNFFDPCLEKREYFSSYVFEEKAIKLLDEIPGLREKFEQEKKSNPEFKEDHRAQLKFIYDRSPFAEKSFMRYPVSKINKSISLPTE